MLLNRIEELFKGEVMVFDGKLQINGLSQPAKDAIQTAILEEFRSLVPPEIKHSKYCEVDEFSGDQKRCTCGATPFNTCRSEILSKIGGSDGKV